MPWRCCTGHGHHDEARRCEMNSDTPIPLPLGRLQPQATDLDAIKERGWRDQHILVVNASDERLDFYRA